MEKRIPLLAQNLGKGYDVNFAHTPSTHSFYVKFVKSEIFPANNANQNETQFIQKFVEKVSKNFSTILFSLPP